MYGSALAGRCVCSAWFQMIFLVCLCHIFNLCAARAEAIEKCPVGEVKLNGP